jgi:hypothetical protein
VARLNRRINGFIDEFDEFDAFEFDAFVDFDFDDFEFNKFRISISSRSSTNNNFLISLLWL